MDWRMAVAQKWVLNVPRGVEGQGLVVGSVSFYPKGILSLVAELVRVHESEAVYWVDKHQDNIDTSCEHDSRIRYL